MCTPASLGLVVEHFTQKALHSNSITNLPRMRKLIRALATAIYHLVLPKNLNWHSRPDFCDGVPIRIGLESAGMANGFDAIHYLICHTVIALALRYEVSKMWSSLRKLKHKAEGSESHIMRQGSRWGDGRGIIADNASSSKWLEAWTSKWTDRRSQIRLRRIKES